LKTIKYQPNHIYKKILQSKYYCKVCFRKISHFNQKCEFDDDSISIRQRKITDITCKYQQICAMLLEKSYDFIKHKSHKSHFIFSYSLSTASIRSCSFIRKYLSMPPEIDAFKNIRISRTSKKMDLGADLCTVWCQSKKIRQILVSHQCFRKLSTIKFYNHYYFVLVNFNLFFMYRIAA